MLKKSLAVMILFMISSALLFGCSTVSSSSSTPSPETVPSRAGVYSYLGTQSPGDTWSWTIGEGVVTATNETEGITYSGTYVTYASGFSKLTVTYSTDPSVPLDGSSTAYFLEYPNTMLIVAGKDDNPMVCTVKATEAPSAGRYSFVKIPSPYWNPGSESYGTAEVTVNAGLYSFNVSKYDINGLLVERSTQTDFSFSDGRLSKIGNPLQVFMTPSGAFFGDNGTGLGGFCGICCQDIDLADLVSKEYRGAFFSYDPATNSNDNTSPIGAEPNSSMPNTLTGFGFEDVELNTRLSETASIQFSTRDSSGVLSGVMREASGAETIFQMVVAKVSGKYIVMGISMGSDGKPQNMLLVQI